SSTPANSSTGTHSLILGNQLGGGAASGPRGPLVMTGGLVNGNFSQGLTGWTVSDPNQVTVNAANQAVLQESPTTLEVDLSQDFTIPIGVSSLTFIINGFTFDDQFLSGITPDAFGVSLVDPATLLPLTPVVDASTDSYFTQDVEPTHTTAH